MPPNTAASRQVRVLLRCAVVIKPIFRSGTVIDRRWGGVKEGRCCKKTALSITAGIRPALDVSTVPKQNGVGKVWRARRVRKEESFRIAQDRLTHWQNVGAQLSPTVARLVSEGAKKAAA